MIYYVGVKVEREMDMSTQLPRLEARVSAQERLQTLAYARMEEISEDMNASFKQQAAYQVQLEQKIDARFDKVDVRFDKVDARFDKMDARLDKMDVRFNEIEAKMATKEDVAALEKRVLNV
jgi:hypothetical protein